MIAHVAEAGEDSGRVVLQLGPQLSDLALDAALQVAGLFRSEVEGLYVNDNLLDLAALSFAREISVTGAVKGVFDHNTVQRRQHRTAAAIMRRATAAAGAAGIGITCAVRQQDAARALTDACAERGPWNIVALGEPLRSHEHVRLRELFASVWGSTGFMLVGPKARRLSGPVIAVIEDIEHFASMLRTAEQLASANAATVEMLLAGQSAEHALQMEAQARLILTDETRDHVPITPIGTGGVPAIGRLLREREAGFVIARFDGIAVPSEGEQSLLAEDLEGPLLLVR